MFCEGRRAYAAAAFAIAFSVCLTAAARVTVTASSSNRAPRPASRTTLVTPTPANTETRALWVLRSSLSTPQSIASLVTSARAHGFNTLLVQVRGRGDAYYLGGLEPRAADLVRQPDNFDPLATVLEAGHAAGLRIHAWINVNLVSSASELPAAREHLVYRHPAWLMVPRDIGQQMAAIDSESPGYVGTLARWTRAHSTEIEGLYTTPIVPEAAQYTESVVRDLVRRYAIDGVHFDYARYPNDRFDYSRAAIREFRNSIRSKLPDSTRRSLDAQEPDDLFAYPDGLPEQWRNFRVERMTALMNRLHATVKRERPTAMVSLAVAPDPHEARQLRLQDWRSWLDAGLADAVCPMAYTTESARFAELIGAARDAAGSRPVWAGIGAYRLSPKETIDNIQTARRLGAAGVVLFSYDSLINSQQPVQDYLSVVGRGAFSPPPPATSGSR